ncbi:MAG: aminodeoxychorismate synthase component I [Prevotella sp.]|nr:aminodeoxychorismate synthase component I [Prevotellaceae bacterium]MDY3936635.1 aminodeoxychorismate synthase component I [Prevotella sp.]
MKIYSREAAKARINELAKNKKSFVFIISYDQKSSYVEELSSIDANELLVKFPHFSNAPKSCEVETESVDFSFSAPDRTAYEQSINFVKQNICAGNSYLTNLTCKVPIETNLNLREIFLQSDALYKCWVKDCFVCFSPEIFVRIKDGRIYSYPMKGTINASIPNATQTLLHNPKEAAEHATIVDLIRNDLSMVAHKVRVTKYRYIDKVATNKGNILQTSSEISGQIKSDYIDNIGDLLFRLLPAGSITGAPKKKTTEIIAAAESYNRGFYTGIMGCYKDGCLDSSVMIRFIENEDGHYFYKAGGGITAQSNNDAEYNEVKEKIYVPIYRNNKD